MAASLVTTAAAATVKHLPLPASYRWRVGTIVGTRLEPASQRQATVHMAPGFKMRLAIGESYERAMAYSGQYAPHLTRLVKHLLTSGDTFVDGGANIGYFSLLAARLVGPTGQVHAFEPIPTTFKRLETHVALNGFQQIHANCQALRDEPGTLLFEVPEKHGQKLGRLATIVQRGQGPQVQVQATTLDAYAKEHAIEHIRLIKLDVEGSEVAAIGGMQRLLFEQRIDYLVCELNTVLLDALGLSYTLMREALTAHGYRTYYLRTRRLRGPLYLEDIATLEPPDRYGDYLFVAPHLPAPPKRI